MQDCVLQDPTTVHYGTVLECTKNCYALKGDTTSHTDHHVHREYPSAQKQRPRQPKLAWRDSQTQDCFQQEVKPTLRLSLQAVPPWHQTQPTA